RLAVFAHDRVERIGGDVFLREVRRHADDAGAERRRERRMIEPGFDDSLELRDELVHAFGRKIELEELDGDEALARRVVCPEHRTQRAGAYLMKNTKRSERVRERSARCFRVQ